MKTRHRTVGGQVKSGLLLVLALAVPFILAGGIAFVSGKGRAATGGSVYKLAGAMMLLGTVTILVMTVRRWAKYFWAVCALAALKAILALVFGRTVSQPRLVTNRLLVAEILLLLLALVVLTYRYVDTVPKSKFEIIALAGGVVGFSATLLSEPNEWPLIAAVLLLGASWLADRMSRNSLRA